MIKKFELTFSPGQIAKVVEISALMKLAPALKVLGLSVPKMTIELIGGAGKFQPTEMQAVDPFMKNILPQLIRQYDCYLVDGGTDSGVMRLVGQMRQASGVKFSLIGVAIRRTVVLPGETNPFPEAVALEPNHSHFILLPGTDWGDESPWISQIVTFLSRGKPALTILINGGEISRKDVQHSLDAGRPVVALAGSGRLADEFAQSKHKPDLLKIINLNESGEKILQELESILMEAKDE